MPTKQVEFHDEGGVEYDAAFDWYLERSTEAALDFDPEVNRALSDIVSAPHRWAAGPHIPPRRYLLRRFPYILIYRERMDDIQSVAVAHTSRRPWDIGRSDYENQLSQLKANGEHAAFHQTC